MTLLLLFGGASSTAPSGGSSSGVPLGLRLDMAAGMFAPRRHEFPWMDDDEFEALLLLWAAMYL